MSKKAIALPANQSTLANDGLALIRTNCDAPFVMDMRPHWVNPNRISADAPVLSNGRSSNNGSHDPNGMEPSQPELRRHNASSFPMEDIPPEALRGINEPPTWVSSSRPPARRTSAFANRQHKPYKPKGTTMSAAAGTHAASAQHPNSTNPSRFWLGTYYPTAEEQLDYTTNGNIPELRMVTGSADIECWRGQWEMGGLGDKAGKLHVQFAVAFLAKCRAPQARVILGGDWGRFDGWLDVARSAAVWDYVKKEETRVQDIEDYGELTDNSGQRTDLDHVYAEIAKGVPIYDIAEQFPRQFMRNHAAIAKLCAMYDKPRPYGDCTVEIWWGVTGSGKSHKAFHTYPDAYRKSIPGKWWEGYRGQDTVIFEEFNPEEDKELKLPELLKILDKYPYQVEVKGASMQLKANRFIFTSNIDPSTWYKGHPQVPAFCRRISKVIKFALDRPQQELLELDGQIEFQGLHCT